MLSKRLPENLSDSPFFCKLSAVKTPPLRRGPDRLFSDPHGHGTGPEVPRRRRFRNGAPETERRRTASLCAKPSRVITRQARGFQCGRNHPHCGHFGSVPILFKTFCDAGDTILTPVPGYPLLDALAGLEYLHAIRIF